MKNAIWLPGYTITMEYVRDGVQHFQVACATATEACGKCGVVGRLYRHGLETATFRDIPSFGKQVEIRVIVQRYRCRECGGTTNQPLPGMNRKRHMTDRCIEWVVERGIINTFSSVAREVGVDEKTIRNICIPAFRERLANHTVDVGPRKIGLPVILGIDELMLDGKMRAIFMDVGRGRVLDIIEGHHKWEVARWLFGMHGREMVQVVTIDMSTAYRDVAKGNLPNATIVIDKFHVQRCANQALDRVRNRARRQATGAGRRNPWRGQRLLRMREHRLNPQQAMEVDGIVANNPLVKAAYEAKEGFYRIWDAADRADAERRFDAWKATIPADIKREFGRIAGMVERWRKEIFNYFDHAHTNAITENRNGLIKTLYRNGRGYTFEVIRAKALLSPPLPKTTKECPCCQKHATNRSFVEVRRFVRAENDTYIDHLCGSCAHVFTKMYVPFVEGAEASYGP
jgi:transposase